MGRAAALLVVLAGCTKPVAVEQDAGPGPMAQIEPDKVCPGAGCEQGGQAGELRIGAAKRSIVPEQFELVNTAYLNSNRPEICDPAQPRRGSGHRHRIMLIAEQVEALAALAEGETISLTSGVTIGHSHEVVARRVDGQLLLTSDETNGHSHSGEAPELPEPAADTTLWTEAGHQARCGEMARKFNDFDRRDCGLDGLCEGDDGWPGADAGEGDGAPDWFFDCGLDGLCPDNEPEVGEAAANGLDDDNDGLIDDGPYPGPDEGEGDGQYQGLWQAGFGSNIPSLGVHDPIWARCFAVHRGDTSVAVCSVDLVGFFWDDVERVRALVAESMGADAPDHILISATHVHEAPDSLGQWGPITNENDVMPRKSGVNPQHIALVRARIAEAVEEATRNAVPARLKLATVRTGTDQLLRDSRDPQVLDDTATVMQAIKKADGATITTVFNWGNHPEILSDVNNLISSDFADSLRRGLEDGVAAPGLPEIVDGLGGIAIYLQGTVGGLMTPLGLDISDHAGNPTMRRSFASSVVMGEKLAMAGLAALRSDAAETVEEGVLTVRVKRFDVPIFNTQFHIAFLFELFDRAIHQYDPAELITAGDDETPRNLPHARTEVDRIVIGPLALLSVPGELFPELAVVDGLKAPYPYTPEGRPIIGEGNPNPPDLHAGPAGPFLRELTHGAKHTMVVGLGNDELGYIVPNYDFKTHPETPYFEEALGDHYEETNSTGPEITALVIEALRGLERWLP